MNRLLQFLGIEVPPRGKYYVYELLDVRLPQYTWEGVTGMYRTFYVGKGTDDRMYQHKKDMEALLKKGRWGVMHMLPHHKRILEIIDDGDDVKYRIMYRTDNECEAYAVESYLIELYGLEHLSNSTYGHKKKDCQPLS